MLYLIGGIARVGKSTISNRLLRHVQMPCVPLDVVRNCITRGLPNSGLSAQIDAIGPAEAMKPVSLALIRNVAGSWKDACIEGDVLAPAHVSELVAEDIELRCVFLGRSNVQESDITHYEGPNTWFSEETPEVRQRLLEAMIADSLHIKAKCARFGFPYLDVSQGWSTQIERAVNILLNGRTE